MNQEDKQLLLVDLCARLPYGVKVRRLVYTTPTDAIESVELFNPYWLKELYSEKAEFKPYLRPMSSMTEEEMKELKTLCSIYIPTDSPIIGFEEYGIVVFTHHLTNNTYSFKLNISVIDWLNKKIFDYRGLIEKGLAIEVTEENNPYKQ